MPKHGLFLAVQLSFFLSFSCKAEAKYPIVPTSEVDQLLCYMQTSDGRILNLGTLCGRSPISITRNCLAATAADLPMLNVNYDGQLLSGQVSNQSCKTLKYIRVNYEVLDASGNTIDNGFIDAEPAPISPGQSAAFRGNVIRGAKVQATHVTWSE